MTTTRTTIFSTFITVALAACSGGARENSATGADEITSCAAGDTVEGVDVSKYEGHIDWNAVKASGHTFAFVRVSDGLTHFDATFATNWANAKAAGVYRGAYIFFRPTEDAVAQADLLLSHGGGDGDFAPVLDVEVTDGASAGHIRAGIDAWSARVKDATGRTPIVYTAPGFWASVGGGARSETLWVANWGVSCPKLPSSWSGWEFWQYSDHGRVPGISVPVDVNRFNGSQADLDALVAGGGGGGGGAGGSGGGGAGGTGGAGGSGGGGGATCSSDGDCNPGNDGSGQICVHGVCVDGCHDDSQCPGITQCSGGQCR
jgi:GH25 family lysozyme M1 (1,4-beta-N-acetylmuramidase)